MEYNKKDLPKDFLKRTIELVKQYKTLKNSADLDYFNVTLSINCFFGTIIMPKANWYEKLSSVQIGADEISGVLIKGNNHINLQELLHCIRNGIAHWLERGNDNITFDVKDGDISSFCINGSGNVNGRKLELSVTFNVEENGMINLMEKVKTSVSSL